MRIEVGGGCGPSGTSNFFDSPKAPLAKMARQNTPAADWSSRNRFLRGMNAYALF